MDPDRYLERIGYTGPRQPAPETLAQLHRAHLHAVPFENLDIPLGHPIALSLLSFYDKIVRRRRGGFCYELNGLFGWLLEQLGFAVTLLSARVFHQGQPGPEFEHILLLVQAEKRLIADVGFGDSFLEPLPLVETIKDERYDTSYRLAKSEAARVLQRRRPGSEWEPQFSFTLAPRRLADFTAMCRRLQTSPESAFTRKAVCSLPTADGRVTLSGSRLILTAGGRREEREVASAEEYRALLWSYFGIELGGEARVDRLMALTPPSN
jgi:N-hydroxyarylamine O-acetyltransferase